MFKEIVRRFKSEETEDIQWVVNKTMIGMILVIVAFVIFFLIV